MFTMPSRGKLIRAGCIAAVFAIPIVTLVSCFVVFPILFYGALAIFVNAGPVILLIAFALARTGMRVDFERLWHGWVQCAIIWTGCAVGFSRWGDAGASIGARNQPFLEVFFAPILLSLGYQLG